MRGRKSNQLLLVHVYCTWLGDEALLMFDPDKFALKTSKPCVEIAKNSYGNHYLCMKMVFSAKTIVQQS